MVFVCLVFLAVCYQFDNVIGDLQQEDRTAIAGGNAPKSIESALFSIESRLRELDLVYVARSYAPRHQAWDTEQYTRRLDTIESRIGRVEALLEMRLDKIQETLSANQLKQTLASDQLNRKIEALSDRINHRMSYMENRLDLDVAKIQTSIDTGFTRLARTETENILETDIESQLQELQRQFELFDTSQNATRAKLSELANKRCFGRSELNDAEEVDKEYDRNESDRFAFRMENVATKVHKMVEEFSHRSQTMESLVKTSMSLANATRRELQDGLKTLGLRLGFYGKHNKDSTIEFGWDALASLITKEFARVAASHDKLVATQVDFRQSCHRLQDKEQQLSETVAKVLDGILDLIRNRSQDMEKHVSQFQEELKNHNNQILHTVSAATKTEQSANVATTRGDQERRYEKLHSDLIQLQTGIQALQEQFRTLQTAHPSCPDSSAIADRLLASITKKQSHDLFEHLTSARRSGRPPAASNKQNVKKEDSRINILDILDEEHGETLHYNVTEGNNDFEAGKQISENIAENSTEGNDYDFDKTDKSDQVYDDDVDGMNLEDDIISDNRTRDDISDDFEATVSKENGTAATSEMNQINNITTNSSLEKQYKDGNSMISEETRIQRPQSDRGENTTDVHQPGVQFSSYWHRMRHVDNNAGHQKTSVPARGGSEEVVKTEDRIRVSGNHELKMLDRAEINDDDTDYNNYEE